MVFIYGPPAVGKYTVGTELARVLDYKILENHKTVEMVRQLFPFEDPDLNTIRRRLQTRFRLEMFEEAAKAEVNFVTTCAIAGPQHFEFYRKANSLVTEHGGHVYFVQLAPTVETMLARVEGESRKNIKIETKDRLRQLLEREPEVFDTFPDVPHMRLDNSKLLPIDAALKIKEYYAL